MPIRRDHNSAVGLLEKNVRSMAEIGDVNEPGYRYIAKVVFEVRSSELTRRKGLIGIKFCRRCSIWKYILLYISRKRASRRIDLRLYPNSGICSFRDMTQNMSYHWNYRFPENCTTSDRFVCLPSFYWYIVLSRWHTHSATFLLSLHHHIAFLLLLIYSFPSKYIFLVLVTRF